MKKDVKDMSVEEILERIGTEVSFVDVAYILKDSSMEDKLEDKLKDLYEKVKIYPNDNSFMYQFLIENEEYINKEALVLFTLERYINFRKNINTPTFYIEKSIEECRRMLENKDISVYRFTEDPNSGKIMKKEELSSIELCCDIKMNNNIKLTKEQSYINAQRQLRLNKKRNDEKKAIEKNKRRLASIEKIIGLNYLLKFISVDDLEHIVIPNKKIDKIFKHMIVRNSLVNGLNFDPKTIKELIKSDEIYEYTNQIDVNVYIEEFENVVRDNIKYFDIDKILLCSAYRLIEEIKLNNSEELENFKIIISTILHKIDRIDTKLSGNFVSMETGEKVKVDYGIEHLKRDMMRFIDEDTFLTDKMITQTKEVLLKGDKTLREFKTDVIWQLGFENEEWDKIVKMSSPNFIFFLDECNPKEEDIKEVISEIKEISTECLHKLLDKKVISQNEIVEICKQDKVNLEQLIELANIDMLEDNTIIDVFNALQEKENTDLLARELLLEYFNIKKLKEYIDNNKIDNEFLEFYSSILPEREEERNNMLNKINELIPGIADKSIIIEFYNAKFIEQEKLIETVNDNDILELYENGKIDVNTANELYRLGIIEQDTMALVVDEEYKTGDIMKGLEDGTIDISIALELYPDKKIYGTFKKYTEGIFKSPNPAIYAFITSNMEIEDLDKLYKKGIVKEKDLKDIVMQVNVSKLKITELYVNMLISEEIIDELNKNGIITIHDTELMKKALGMKNIVKNMDKSLGIAFGSDGEIELDEGIFLPEEKAGKTQREWENDYFPSDAKVIQLKKVISPAIRERKFEMYGAKRIKRNNVEYNEKSPFNDYEFYIIPDEQGNITPDCIVFAERYYEDKYSGEEKLIDGNATYLFELKDLTRISKKSKTEILSEMKEAKDKRMKRKFHSKNWGKNIDKAVEELSGRKLESCYSESEIHDIRTISELIDGFKDKGKTYRMFDVEFY